MSDILHISSYLLSYPHFRWHTGVSEKLSNFLNITQPPSGQVWLKIQASPLLKPVDILAKS